MSFQMTTFSIRMMVGIALISHIHCDPLVKNNIVMSMACYVAIKSMMWSLMDVRAHNEFHCSPVSTLFLHIGYRKCSAVMILLGIILLANKVLSLCIVSLRYANLESRVYFEGECLLGDLQKGKIIYILWIDLLSIAYYSENPRIQPRTSAPAYLLLPDTYNINLINVANLEALHRLPSGSVPKHVKGVRGAWSSTVWFMIILRSGGALGA